MRANSRSNFVWFGLWVFLAAFSQTAGSNPQSVPREPTAARVPVPFELYDTFVFLQVRVNGSEPRSFLLDTGASTSLLSHGDVTPTTRATLHSNPARPLNITSGLPTGHMQKCQAMLDAGPPHLLGCYERCRSRYALARIRSPQRFGAHQRLSPGRESS